MNTIRLIDTKYQPGTSLKPVLVFGILVLTLTGCGGGPSSQGAPVSESPPSAEPPPPAPDHSPSAAPAKTEEPPPADAEELQRFLDQQAAKGTTSVGDMMSSPEYQRLSPEAKERFRRWLAPAQASLDEITKKIQSGEIPRQMDEGIEAIKAEEARKVMEKAAPALRDAVRLREGGVPAVAQDEVILNLVIAYGELAPAVENLARIQARLDHPPGSGGSSMNSAPSDPFAMAASLKRELELIARGDQGVKALFFAVDESKYFSVNALIEAGVDVHTAGPNGQTALQLAEARGYKTIVELLQRAVDQRRNRNP